MRLTTCVLMGMLAACGLAASAEETKPATQPTVDVSALLERMAERSKQEQALEAAASTAPAAFAIPKVEKITIDGNAADWQDAAGKDLGFCLNVLGEVAVHPPTDSAGVPAVRLAWTNEGMAFLFRVHDATPHEAADMSTLFDGDSVEVFLSDLAHPKQYLHVAIAPGLDVSKGGKMRVNIVDYREDKSKPEKLTVKAAVSRAADGYVVEAMIPFADLGITPAAGMKLGVQLHVNDRIAPGQIAIYRWLPTHRGYRGPEYHQAVELAEKPSNPVNFAVNTDYLGFRLMRLRISSAATQPVTLAVKDEKDILNSAEISGPRGHIDLRFPDKPYGRMVIFKEIDGNLVEIAAGPFTPDSPPSRASALNQVQITFGSFAFSGDTFPVPNAIDPLIAEPILGNYKVLVRYFDATCNEVSAPAADGRYGALVRIESETNKLTEDRVYTLYKLPAEIKSWREVDFSLKSVEFPKELGVSPEVSGQQGQITADLFKDLVQQDLRKSQTSSIVLAALSETKPGDPAMVWRTNPAAVASAYDYTLRKKLGLLKPYPYLTHLPPDYDADKNKKFPLIVFLHGSGERGNGNLDLLKTTGFPQYLEAHPEFPAVVVSPQCPFNNNWRPQMVNDLLDDALAKYRVDPDRVYMTGLSMGGYGTWAYAATYPDRLAAMLPICGIGDARDVERIKNIPIWDFHGEVDDQVPIGPDRLCVAALKAAGSGVKFTTYPGVGHDSWTQTYNNAEIYAWLFAQSRKHGR